MGMEARVGIGEAWPVLPPGNLSGRVQACLSRPKPTQARNGHEVRVWVRVWVRSLINCSSNPIATGQANWTPPRPEFPSCAQLDCWGNGREGIGPGWADLRNGDGAQSSATQGVAVAAHHRDRLHAPRKAGKRCGKDQANVVAKNFGPNRKRACDSRFIERIGPAATYTI
jgi:hypothetical protein